MTWAPAPLAAVTGSANVSSGGWDGLEQDEIAVRTGQGNGVEDVDMDGDGDEDEDGDRDGDGDRGGGDGNGDGDDGLGDDEGDDDGRCPGIEGVVGTYVKIVLGRIKEEIDGGRKPRCYREGQMWIRSPDPIFTKLKPTEDGGFSPEAFYARDIFVWLPDLLMDISELRCPNPLCQKKGHLESKGKAVWYNHRDVLC